MQGIRTPIIRSCDATLIRFVARRPKVVQTQLSQYRSSSSASNPREDEIAAILSKPTWSVKSLLTTPSSTAATADVTPKQLRHLLRLSALPQPSNEEEEQSMLKTLQSQIYFVKDVQSIDTTGVTPLRAIRDETAAAEEENEITLDALKGALAREERVGRARRIKRTREPPNISKEAEAWEPLSSAQETRGRYFVVRREKNSGSESVD